MTIKNQCVQPIEHIQESLVFLALPEELLLKLSLTEVLLDTEYLTLLSVFITAILVFCLSCCSSSLSRFFCSSAVDHCSAIRSALCFSHRSGPIVNAVSFAGAGKSSPCTWIGHWESETVLRLLKGKIPINLETAECRCWFFTAHKGQLATVYNSSGPVN